MQQIVFILIRLITIWIFHAFLSGDSIHTKFYCVSAGGEVDITTECKLKLDLPEL